MLLMLSRHTSRKDKCTYTLFSWQPNWLCKRYISHCRFGLLHSYEIQCLCLFSWNFFQSYPLQQLTTEKGLFCHFFCMLCVWLAPCCCLAAWLARCCGCCLMINLWQWAAVSQTDEPLPWSLLPHAIWVPALRGEDRDMPMGGHRIRLHTHTGLLFDWLTDLVSWFSVSGLHQWIYNPMQCAVSEVLLMTQS